MRSVEQGWTRRRFLALAATAAGAGCASPAREVLVYPHPLLQTPAEPVDRFGKPVEELARALLATVAVRTANGLAAPQIGVPARVIAARADTGVRVMVNPEIAWQGGRFSSRETCLSLPGRGWFTVERAERVRVVFQDPGGEHRAVVAAGRDAAVLQHEIDHLDGRLLLDRA